MWRLIIPLVFVQGCVSAEGELFRSPAGGVDGGTSLLCVPSDELVVPSEGLRIGGALAGPMPVVTVTRQEATHALTLAMGSSITVARDDLLASNFWLGVAQPLVNMQGQSLLLFGNHHLAGSWNIFTQPFGPLDANRFVRISSDGLESVGPKGMFRGDDLGVAYRQGEALTFARLAGSLVASHHAFPATLPHPTVDRVVATAEGFAVLYHRSDASVAFMDAAGQPAGDVNLLGMPADMWTDNGNLAVVVHREGALVLLHPGTQRTPKVLSPLSLKPRRITVEPAAAGALIAWWSDASGGSITLARLANESLSSVQTFAASLPPDPDLVLVSSGTSALMLSNEVRNGVAAFVARRLCP